MPAVASSVCLCSSDSLGRWCLTHFYPVYCSWPFFFDLYCAAPGIMGLTWRLHIQRIPSKWIIKCNNIAIIIIFQHDKVNKTPWLLGQVIVWLVIEPAFLKTQVCFSTDFSFTRLKSCSEKRNVTRKKVHLFCSGEICSWAAADPEQLLKMNKAGVTPCNKQSKFKFK